MSGVPLLDLMKDTSGHARTFKRYPVELPLFARPVAEEAAFPASIPEDPADGLPGLARSISLSGIGFVCGSPFDPASLTEIEITLEEHTYSLLARIHWSRRLDLPGGPLYYYGAKFLRTEAALEFIPVMARFLLTLGGERAAGRRSRRTSGPAPAEPQATWA